MKSSVEQVSDNDPTKNGSTLLILSKNFNTVAALLVSLDRLSRSFLPISHSCNSFHARANGAVVSPSPHNAILSVCTVGVVFQDFSLKFSHPKKLCYPVKQWPKNSLPFSVEFVSTKFTL